MKIINIIDDSSTMNMGVWQAALSPSKKLSEDFGVQSIAIAPEGEKFPENIGIEETIFIRDKNKTTFLELIRERKWNINNSLIATHGCWQYPSIWGAAASELGFKWVHCTHGMLEPWPLRQNRLLKFLYFNLIEKGHINKCNVIRASSSPEEQRLKKIFPDKEMVLIPNGVHRDVPKVSSTNYAKTTILFLGRLHVKKSPVEIVNGFLNSNLANNQRFELLVGGPDQGLKTDIEKLIINSSVDNIKMIGPQYGDDKNELLKKSTFFILPSKSEGFPSAVVEAMSYGAIPIISQGVNFPEAIQAGVAIEVETNSQSITRAFNEIETITSNKLVSLQRESQNYIFSNFCHEHIARDLYELVDRLL